MHLLLYWGAGFRTDFQKIGLALSRMPQWTVCIGYASPFKSGVGHVTGLAVQK